MPHDFFSKFPGALTVYRAFFLHFLRETKNKRGQRGSEWEVWATLYHQADDKFYDS